MRQLRPTDGRAERDVADVRAEAGYRLQVMNALRWTAFEGSPFVTPVEANAGPAEFLDVLERAKAKGAGYVEVCHADHEFPMLALSLAQSRGVVHQFASETISLLLAGDGSVHSSTEVELPVMDGTVMFTGAFVLAADAACEVVRAFALGAAVSDLGEWTPL
jgi:hypothetical protein